MFKRVVIFFQGRHTLFVCWFAATGLVLAAIGKLGMPYVALCSALQAAVGLHSFKEDVSARNNKTDNDAQANVQNPVVASVSTDQTAVVKDSDQKS